MSTETVEKEISSLSQRKLTPREIQILQEALSVDHKVVNIRLREGEYQYILAKTIASFQLELCFPDVKDIIGRLYGEEKADDVQFVRKIQTILKKMEKSNIVRILKKKRPWELQRYALSSFKFRDSDKNLVVLATEQQTERMQSLSRSMLTREKPTAKLSSVKIKIFFLVFAVATSYATILWGLIQPIINPVIFIPAFSVAVACSLMLGKLISQE